jgi:hypothetical protein
LGTPRGYTEPLRGGAGNRSTRRNLNPRRINDPRLEHTRIHHCDSVFRRRRRVFSRHAAHNGMACEKEVTRASTTLDNFFAPLSFARAFAVPVIILEPAKPLAGYLLGTGHFFFGAVTFITAEVLKLTLVEQLFQLNRKKLLSIPAFAWGYRYWRDIMDLVESLEVWRASRSLVANAGGMVRARWLQLKQIRPFYPFHASSYSVGA